MSDTSDLRDEFLAQVVGEEPDRCFDLLVKDRVLSAIWDEMVEDHRNSAICGTCHGGASNEFPCSSCGNSGLAYPKRRRCDRD